VSDDIVRACFHLFEPVLKVANNFMELNTSWFFGKILCLELSRLRHRFERRERWSERWRAYCEQVHLLNGNWR